jgi:hypothetical protein
VEFFFLFFLFCIVIGILAVPWLILRQKSLRLEAQVVELTNRVFRLGSDRSSGTVAKEETTSRPPVVVFQHTEEERADIELAKPVEFPKAEPALVPSEISVRISAPSATFGERIRKYLGDEEWEALVGGSLLNKLGALLLVIGIALFLGYSFTHMTPGGRALTSLGASVCLLGGGVFLERKQTYRILARGLIGAGWAALYVTAYARYAVPAARLIGNPYIGSLVLLAVAAGMIGHSLLYRVQAITAVAYFAVFAALGVTPSSSFALISVVPLSASLLYLAWRFDWNAMGVFGVIATYASCIWRGNSDASLFEAESLLLVYWLLFEAFDLLRVRKHAAGSGLEFVFGLNALGFLGLSYRA